MDNSQLIDYLQSKEKDIATLATKLVNFLEAEQITAPLAIGCLAETVNRLTAFLIKDLEDPKAAHALAEQIAGIFVHCITYSLQAHLKEKDDQTPYIELASPDDIGLVAPDLGHA